MKYDITGANKESGRPMSITIEAVDFHDAEIQANEMGIMVNRVVEHREQTPAPAPVPQTAPPPVDPRAVSKRSARRGMTCHACGHGDMKKKKRYRMSGIVVFIGYIILIPSLLGILAAAVLMVGSGGAAALPVAERANAAKELAADGFPAPIVSDVRSGRSVSDARLESLTPEQADRINEVEQRLSISEAGSAATAVLGGGASICWGIGSLVSGLLGWLLVMKKTILQCTTCGAVIAAS